MGSKMYVVMIQFFENQAYNAMSLQTNFYVILIIIQQIFNFFFFKVGKKAKRINRKRKRHSQQ